MGDPAPPLRTRRQQLPVGLQAAHDVLGQLGPVHTHDEPGVPDQVEQGAPAFGDGRLGRALAQQVLVGAQGVHAHLDHPAAVLHGAPFEVDVGAQDLGAAAQEGVGPARAEEAEVVGAEHALQQFPRHP